MLDLRLNLESDQPLRLLCLGAHCDDVEIGAGGTLRRLIEEHDAVEVHWVIFSADEVRAGEARAAAAHFTAGARRVELDVQRFRESYFPDQWAAIKDHFQVTRAAFTPDLVLTHHSADLHQDHRLLAELTWNTFRDHLVLEYEIPKYDADLGSPNCYVSLSEEQARFKVEGVLRFYQSQATKPWFDEESFQAVLRLRGLECNAPARYAEAFHCKKARI